MAVFSSISDTGYDTVITTLGQQDLSNAVCAKHDNISLCMCASAKEWPLLPQTQDGISEYWGTWYNK